MVGGVGRFDGNFSSALHLRQHSFYAPRRHETIFFRCYCLKTAENNCWLMVWVGRGCLHLIHYWEEGRLHRISREHKATSQQRIQSKRSTNWFFLPLIASGTTRARFGSPEKGRRWLINLFDFQILSAERAAKRSDVLDTFSPDPPSSAINLCKLTFFLLQGANKLIHQ